MAGISMIPERPLSNWELVAQLCSWSPHLRAARRVHLDRNGTLVPHLFMADVLARVGACHAAFTDDKSQDRRELEAILAMLERGMRIGDRETRNVVALSFIDDARHEPFFAALLPLLGPTLRSHVASSKSPAPSGPAGA